MAVKLNHYWSIIPGKYDEYETFVIQEFVPGVKQLGLNRNWCGRISTITMTTYYNYRLN